MLVVGARGGPRMDNTTSSPTLLLDRSFPCTADTADITRSMVSIEHPTKFVFNTAGGNYLPLSEVWNAINVVCMDPKYDKVAHVLADKGVVLLGQLLEYHIDDACTLIKKAKDVMFDPKPMMRMVELAVQRKFASLPSVLPTKAARKKTQQATQKSDGCHTFHDNASLKTYLLGLLDDVPRPAKDSCISYGTKVLIGRRIFLAGRDFLSQSSQKTKLSPDTRTTIAEWLAGLWPLPEGVGEWADYLRCRFRNGTYSKYNGIVLDECDAEKLGSTNTM